jgi:RNA polymerase sigma-70 factor (ECF subfamily)
MERSERIAAFEACRSRLVGLAYRMLGDIGRAEDMVQDAWLRWEAHADAVESPQAFLVTVVTRLCLNELASARTRREETRSDRLPEPIDLDEAGITNLERAEEVSMAFVVALQRLTPAERAVLLLHEVFDFDHQQIAALVGTTAPGSRKLLERARRDVASERRLLEASSEQHERLLEAFLHAITSGDVDAVVQLLAEDAVLVTDGGPEGRSVDGRRNLPRPLEGARRIAAFIQSVYERGDHPLRIERRDLNGQPALVFWADDQLLGAMLLAIADDRIARVYFHADVRRLRHAGRS